MKGTYVELPLSPLRQFKMLLHLCMQLLIWNILGDKAAEITKNNIFEDKQADLVANKGLTSQTL